MGTHVIVGAGPVGTATAQALVAAGHEVTLVTRSGSGPGGPRHHPGGGRRLRPVRPRRGHRVRRRPLQLRQPALPPVAGAVAPHGHVDARGGGPLGRRARDHGQPLRLRPGRPPPDRGRPAGGHGHQGPGARRDVGGRPGRPPRRSGAGHRGPRVGLLRPGWSTPATSDGSSTGSWRAGRSACSAIRTPPTRGPTCPTSGAPWRCSAPTSGRGAVPGTCRGPGPVPAGPGRPVLRRRRRPPAVGSAAFPAGSLTAGRCRVAPDARAARRPATSSTGRSCSTRRTARPPSASRPRPLDDGLAAVADAARAGGRCRRPPDHSGDAPVGDGDRGPSGHPVAVARVGPTYGAPRRSRTVDCGAAPGTPRSGTARRRRAPAWHRLLRWLRHPRLADRSRRSSRPRPDRWATWCARRPLTPVELASGLPRRPIPLPVDGTPPLGDYAVAPSPRTGDAAFVVTAVDAARARPPATC